MASVKTVLEPVTPLPTRSSVLLPGTNWKTYTRLLRVFADRPGVRLTYDRGVLEIMSPSLAHDSSGRFLGRLIAIMTEELRLEILSGGSTTLRRQLKRRGLEPDECFWINNQAAVRGARRLDLRVHPPPDVAIEVDVTNSSLDRMGIYAVLRVPEVWRLDQPQLSFQVLGADGKYSTNSRSATFPQVSPTDILNFLNLRDRNGDNMLAREFRKWFRQQLDGGETLAPAP